MKYLIFPALLGLGLAGCSSTPQSTEQLGSAVSPPAATEQPLTPAPPVAPVSPASPAAEAALPEAPAASPVAPAAPRTVAYRGKMNLEVTNFERATTSITQLIDQFGAYPNAAHETRASGQHYQEMTLKVPATAFLHLVVALSKLGPTNNKDLPSTDITAYVVTLSTRITTRQATAAKYRQLLTKASNPAQVRQLEDQNRQLQTELAADRACLQQLGLSTQGLWTTLPPNAALGRAHGPATGLFAAVSGLFQQRVGLRAELIGSHYQCVAALLRSGLCLAHRAVVAAPASGRVLKPHEKGPSARTEGPS